MGQQLSLYSQWFPPTSRFSVDDIPDLTSRVMIVTGGNTGIGKETVRALLEHNATVYLAARSQDRAEAAIDELETDTGKRAIFLELDLAEKASIRRAAKEFLSKEKELHVLFNNGGVMWPPKDQLTKDDYDLQWGVNIVAPFLLTKLLMPALIAGIRSSYDGKARVVTTSSMGAYFDVIHWNTFRPGPDRDKLSIESLYYQSKHAVVIFARELARRYGHLGIIATSCNPGNLDTELLRHTSPIVRFLTRPLLYPVSYGALTQLWAGTSDETVDYNGKFLIPWARLGECRPETRDPEIGVRLWEWLEGETSD